jgi:hypothetical protein
LAHDVNAAVVDGKLAAQCIDDLQHHSNALPWAGDHLEFVFGQLRGIVPHPSTVRLRREHVAGKCFLILRKQTDAGAKDISQSELFEIVVALAAAAMKVDDQGKPSRGLGPEQTVGHRPIALVRARIVFLVETFGLLLERLNQREAFGRIRHSRREGRCKDIFFGR